MTPTDEKERVVLSLLDTWATKEQIVAVTGYSPRSVTRTLEALLQEGAIMRQNIRYKRQQRPQAGLAL